MAQREIAQAASMGPRSCDRGEGVGAGVGDAASGRFNGAAVM